MVRCQIFERLCFPRWPTDFHVVDVIVGSEAEVKAQVVLREIARAAAHLVRLNQISGSDLDSGANREAVAFCPSELEGNPVVTSGANITENHGRAIEILNHDVDRSIVEEIAKRSATADLRNLNGRADKFAYVLESAVVLIQEEQFWFAVFGSGLGGGIHLRIDVAVDDEQIRPSVIIKVEESVAPSNIGSCAGSDSGRVGNIRKIHPTVVPVQRGVLITEMSYE